MGKQQSLVRLTAEQRSNRLVTFVRNSNEIRYLKAELKKHQKEVADRVKILETENLGIAQDLGDVEGEEG